MKIIPLAAAAAAALSLAGCRLMQAPVDMTKRMFQAGGRSMGLGAENTRTPDDFKIEAGEIRAALAASPPEAGSDQAAPSGAVAGR